MTKSNVIYETFPTVLKYLEVKSPYYRAMDHAYKGLQIDQTISVDASSFHKLPKTCPVCLENIEDELNHVEAIHPRCWCDN